MAGPGDPILIKTMSRMMSGLLMTSAGMAIAKSISLFSTSIHQIDFRPTIAECTIASNFSASFA
jgi:hypothetical protein